ncbi:tail fiber protein [Janthinobacterium sp. JC611]|uniref:phage tail protein n=1 Tax=Janthinobacterium sp. JC611 TaxID=2816201 RepID=UPI001BFD97AA|nr:tail fiber protein [Janthinobacterium sp. JC611]
MSDCYVGEIRQFAFSRVPNGWFACDGSLKSIADYQVLFVLLGTTYGGDGQNTFGLPDLRGQLPLHQGQGTGLTNRVIGAYGGSETVTLTTATIPQHTHTYYATNTTADVATPGPTLALGAATGGDNMYATSAAGSVPLVLSTAACGSAGGNLPHENCMPTMAVSFCIAWQGIFPTQQ